MSLFLTKCLHLYQEALELKGKTYVSSRYHLLLDYTISRWYTDASATSIPFMGPPATKKVYVGS